MLCAPFLQVSIEMLLFPSSSILTLLGATVYASTCSELVSMAPNTIVELSSNIDCWGYSLDSTILVCFMDSCSQIFRRLLPPGRLRYYWYPRKRVYCRRTHSQRLQVVSSFALIYWIRIISVLFVWKMVLFPHHFLRISYLRDPLSPLSEDLALCSCVLLLSPTSKVWLVRSILYLLMSPS